MLKTLMSIASLVGVLSLAANANAQALPTATGAGFLQAGGGYTFANPDYGQFKIQGGTAYVDYDFRPHWGVEAEAHIIALITPTDLAENSFLIGPRYVYPHGRFSLYAKGMLGIGNIDIQEAQDNPQGGAGNYFAYAAGAGVDYRLTRHIILRPIDFEYQHWSYLTGLTPTVFTVGAAYRFR